MQIAHTAHPLPPDIPRFRLSVQKYRRMIEAGILGEDDRIELIEGELTVMPPVNPQHAGKVTRLTRIFSERTGDSALVSVQNPLVLGDRSELQTDLMLLRPRKDFYETANPGPEDVLLVVEIADTSLEYDRNVKIPLYAANGIPEVLLVNLRNERLEIHLDPGSSGYRKVLLPDPEQRAAPVSLPYAVFEVRLLW